MKEHLKQMGLIYRNASFTIIAAAGQDPSYGLPGVSLQPRHRQPAIKIGSSMLFGFVAPGIDISKSRWNERAWTFQEATLSPRRLVFTDSQVYFQCCEEQFVESLTGSLPFDSMLLTTSPFPFSSDKPEEDEEEDEDDGDYFYKELEPSTVEMIKHVNGFVGRDLTNQKDAYDAFRGIRKHFRLREPPLQFFMGIPIVQPAAEGIQEPSTEPHLQTTIPPISAMGDEDEDEDEYKGEDEFPDIEDGTQNEQSALKALTMSLCWHIGLTNNQVFSNLPHRPGDPTRRQKFPSWTWLGWKYDRPTGVYRVMHDPLSTDVDVDFDGSIRVKRYHLHEIQVKFDDDTLCTVSDSNLTEICDKSDDCSVVSLGILGWLFEREGFTHLVLASSYVPGKTDRQVWPVQLHALRLTKLTEPDTYERVAHYEEDCDRGYRRHSNNTARIGYYSLRQARIWLK
ncbi:hypothetical protein CEP54_010373 [Fusarium duplospermum]|uniref:Heterokaryon incompatibility domain-containing protein n=1 Tax=Fusarium duplospermum TaxID=1325734 RepID=A0A428PKA9_9HYPO|nr:hypothetical protein CEP54_010373 [Fusarium duplospermum]